MKTDLNQEPVFLTDKNRIVVLEALCSAPNAALPDTCRPQRKTSSGGGDRGTPCNGKGGRNIPSHGRGT